MVLGSGSNMIEEETYSTREERCHGTEVLNISLEVVWSCSSMEGKGTLLEELGSGNCKETKIFGEE